MDKKQGDDLISEVRAVKKLLILQLLKAEVSQKQIAAMLEISEATMSRMMPKSQPSKKPAFATSPKGAE
jgi:DNA-directed RNA polymerase specialized sigma subunit